VNDLIERPRPEEQAVKNVAVIYKYPVFRDLIVHVLDKAGVRIAATIATSDLESTSFSALRPDVVIVYDPEANSLLGEVVRSALLDPQRGFPCKVICIGMENEMVVLEMTVIQNPTVELLISNVLENDPSAISNATNQVWARADEQSI
jgi:hypothetical protein